MMKEWGNSLGEKKTFKERKVNKNYVWVFDGLLCVRKTDILLGPRRIN